MGAAADAVAAQERTDACRSCRRRLRCAAPCLFGVGSYDELPALLGFETAFKHLDGHSVHVKRSGVTKPGQVLRIKGEGMPKHGTPSEFGDLLITFTVDFPKSVEGALADGLESLLPPFSKTDIRIFQ